MEKVYIAIGTIIMYRCLGTKMPIYLVRLSIKTKHKVAEILGKWA